MTVSARRHDALSKQTRICQPEPNNARRDRVEAIAAFCEVLDGPVRDTVVGGVARRRELEPLRSESLLPRREVHFRFF